MSFILDALRKSDQQRRHGQTPTLAAAPRPETRSASGKPPGWPVVLVIALLLFGTGLILGGWLPWHAPSAAPSSMPSAIVPQTSIGVPAPPPRPAASPSTAPAQTGIATPATPPAQAATSRPAAAPEARTTLPPITITAHAWAADPAERMVRINGRMLREGDDIEPGLRLENITTKGILLNHRGRRLKRDLQ